MTLETPVAAIFYDGKSNARRVVNVYLGAALNITEDRRLLASWPLADIRRHDAGDGLMRLGLSTNPLSMLEVDDPALQHRISADCPQLYGSGSIGSVSNLHIVAWSLAAVFSIVVMIFCGIPLLASSLTPLLHIRLKSALAMPSTLKRAQFSVARIAQPLKAWPRSKNWSWRCKAKPICLMHLSRPC